MPVTRFPARASGIADRVAGFIAHLRFNGLAVGTAETGAALEAMTAIDPLDRYEMQLALKAVCANDAERFRRFDDLFDAYWMNAGRARERERTQREKAGNLARQARKGPIAENVKAASSGNPDGPDDANGETETQSGDGRLVAAKMRVTGKTDLRELMTPEDLARASKIAEDIARAIRDRRSRRRRAARRGAHLDLRRIARKSIATGGEPLHLMKKRRPDRPVHLVALLDVSGSMTVYARVFLAFLKGLVSADRRTDAYLFHTRLVRVSDALRERDTLRAVDRLSLMAEGFGGGTRIGANLARFNAHYAAHRVNGRSVAIVLSDGYDTDPPEKIGSALARLKKRGARIVWLNPLKGWKDYEPVAKGMAAALPYLDLFAPANTLDNLKALEPYLAKV